jgi:hypothetical protein
MIHNEEQLAQAQQAIANLQKILVEARKVHTPQAYRALSEPILLEIQQRAQAIIAYLSETEAEVPVG